ncbi:MAG: DUF2961 domain-containing protein [Bryobacteraceae bacterium]|nr:DUF2961 domain-containing protein [Bryobacteraceae bacterium]
MLDAIRSERRGFLRRLLTFSGAAAIPVAAQAQRAQAGADLEFLPAYARAQKYKSLKQSSYDRTGGNADRFQIAPGGTQELFNDNGPGIITHIWFTIAAQGLHHLKELVLRAYWDGASQPSVETPVGDFFGLNLAEYVIYESEYLGCSPGKSLNCYFAMPYRKSARMTVTNEGKTPVGAYYSNIDYLKPPSLPEEALYFHAQYRQMAPCPPTSNDWQTNGDANKLLNPDGKLNYVYAETRGRGQLLGVTLGVLQNQEFWMGEGDDMIFIDDESKPLIIGTGSEDYFLGSWNFGGRDGARAFAHRQYGAQFIALPERTGGRYLCYRFHGDNPVTFERYMKHTMEHGHANHRADNFYSCCYWYQDKPAERFPPLPPLADRIPRIHAVPGPGGAVTGG